MAADAKTTQLRIHVASSTLSRARIVTWVVATAGAVVILVGDPTTAHAGWFLAGIAAVMVVASRRARTETSHCAFCDRTRAEVKCLVAGHAVSICEACTPIGALITTEREEAGWVGVVDMLPKNCPWSLSSAVVDALITRDSSPASIRAAAALAFRLQNMAAAEHAASRLPESERTASDWITLGVTLGKQGRHDEAIIATRRAEGEEHAHWVTNNIAWYSARKTAGASYRDSGTVSRETAARWIRDLDAARADLLERKPDGWKDLAQRCLGTRAEIQRIIGDLDDALASLDRAATDGPLVGEQLLCRGRILAEQRKTDPAPALADLKGALTELHPESNDAADARALIASLEKRDRL